jgi:copper chaperone CopZ
MSIAKYQVTGMTCGGCAMRVKAALASHAEYAEVTLDPPQAILSRSKLSLSALNEVLAGVGNYRLNEVKAEPAHETHSQELPKSWLATYYPLLLIFAFILLVTLSNQLANPSQATGFNLEHWMMQFMAGFFLVFSFFKLLDVRSFADSYAMYDLLAMRFKPYAYLYPFIELGLGIAYLTAWQPLTTNIITFIVMTFSSLGVIRSVLNKQKIRCACLGAVFNLPMSTVTIIEDLLMAGMALWMIVVLV